MNQPSARDVHPARATPAETVETARGALACAEKAGTKPYFHDELISYDTPDGEQSTALWRREAGL